MKKYAYYLPQFHEIPENNKWWGEGFTEWVNVKKARPLIKNHNQPKKPLNNNYYELNEDTLRWQADLAMKYHIDGMIFYHYYFCGKKLLEKPAEILLKNKDIPMNFFFCWANHSWYRSWEGTKELLMEQTYGDVNDWEKHFQYLLPFFQDYRYQKKDNKPLFMLFQSSFKQNNNIAKYFDKRCRDYGFDGIQIIESIQNYDTTSCNIDNSILHTREPNCSSMRYKFSKRNILFRIRNKILKILNKYTYLKYIEQYDGDILLKIAADNYRQNIIPGLFFEWDNTPRHGYRGYLISSISKEAFFIYMDTIKDSEFVFINAWNEWCEGMMLEPTSDKKYLYLEWLKEWTENNENRTYGSRI